MRIAFIALTLLLAACAGPIETRVNSAGVTPAMPTSFIVNPEITGPAAGVQAKVAATLVERGYTQSDDGQLKLHVTAADRPAALALQSGDRELAKAAGKQKCAAREYRIGIVLTRIADGTDYYRASTAEFHCKLTMDEVLPILVRAALADLGAPRGSYTLNRPRPGEFRLIPAM
jgi:hypothetical protein